ALVANARGGAVIRAIDTLNERHLAPFTKKNFKDVLVQCDQYGVDHRSLFDATALMMAARAGNVALVQALLERGADLEVRDLFGHTPVMHALERAALDAVYAAGPFAAIYAQVAPRALDVETDGRLIRLYPHQGEYFLLLTMLANLKTLGSQLVPQNVCPLHRRSGFNTAWLMRNLEHVAHSVLREERRKRTWFNAVLARAEVGSAYQPARRLWMRSRNGFYVPNPTLRVQVLGGDGQNEWQSWQEAMKLRLVLAGIGAGETGLVLEDLLPRQANDSPAV
ncbi:MAG: ankyrin repeat domain-containing protein, partial [Dokdonella sp.]